MAEPRKVLRAGRMLGHPRPGAHTAQPIDVLEQGGPNVVPHGIKNEIDALTPRQLGRRYEIGVARDQNNLIHLPLVG
jgi:hypothetical protein